MRRKTQRRLLAAAIAPCVLASGLFTAGAAFGAERLVADDTRNIIEGLTATHMWSNDGGATWHRAAPDDLFKGTKHIIVASLDENLVKSSPWSAEVVYDKPGIFVTHNGKVYTSKYWTSGDVPGAAEFGPWQLVGNATPKVVDEFDFTAFSGAAADKYQAEQRARGLATKRVAGYFPEWGIYQAHDYFTPDKVNFDQLTHLNYGFGLLKKASDGTWNVEIGDSWASLEKDGGNIARLNAAAKAKGVTTMISFGGWTNSENGEFEDATATPEKTDHLAQSMVDFMVKYGFGGIDVDWEYPTDDQAKKQFTSLLKVLKQKLTDLGKAGDEYYQLSVATTANHKNVRYIRKLGPDPASEIACTIGGVVANNSSGMSCGIHANSYRTLASAVLVLPSGTVIDTGAPDAADRLLAAEPTLHDGLLRLRDRVRADARSVATLSRLHAIKNTMGYGLNAFLDHDEPVRILEHLVIGSEGTLAFVAEAVFRTVPVLPECATGLLIFADLAGATASLRALVDAGFATVELLDAASLRVAQRDPEAPDDLRALAIADHAALLVEFQCATAEELADRMAEAPAVFAGLPLAAPGALTTDASTRSRLWHIRKGLYTAVAGARPSGTTALLEDVAVPVDVLGETCSRLIELFERHGYADSVIFGHAKDGNIHFLINERFDDPRSLARYEAFTEDMVDVVLSAGGTLKAEHGTGRIMAPYVRRQYGDELYDVMWEVKRLIDPQSQLNPGVLLTEDPGAHVRDLKVAATVEAEVDRCVECGYCEPVCPSRDLTLTPRERIVLRRELQAARDRDDHALVRELEQQYEYDGVETCAVDGMCQTACPVLINTGDLVRRLRAESAPTPAKALGKAAAAHWDGLTRAGARALDVAAALPTPVPALATRAARAVLGADVVPLYSGDLPAGGERRRVLASEDPHAVYFSSCTTTMFGAQEGDGVSGSFLRLCERAGVRLTTPDDLPSLCCGTPWKSKGLREGYDAMTARVAASLRRATDDGRLPVVCDASSCTEGLQLLLDAADEGGIRVIDAVAFVADRVLPRLPAGTRVPSVTLHPTCSSTHLGLDRALHAVAAAAAEVVVVPDDWGCCGFAGDRGMLHPELTASATAREADAVRAAASTRHASLNRTCEIGMSRATGERYEHILDVLDGVVS